MTKIIIAILCSLSLLCQAADPEAIKRYEQRSEQPSLMDIDTDEPVSLKRPRTARKLCIRKDARPAKRRRIQTPEEAQEMAPDIVTLVSNDNKKLYISKEMADLSPILKSMLDAENFQEAQTQSISFNEFNQDELSLLVDVLTSISKNRTAPFDTQAEILNQQNIINRHKLTTSQKLADFFQLPVIMASLGLRFITSSGLQEATIKAKLSAKKYFETGQRDADFRGVSIQDLIDHNQIPEITTSDYNQKIDLDLRGKFINSLYGLESIPKIETVQMLDLNNNQLTSLPDGIFDKLTNLEWLELNRNQLTSLPDGIFNKLTQLNDLDLSMNRLTTLPDGIFDQLTQLRKLNFSGNKLASLPDGIFDQLTNLTELVLSNNKLPTLPDGIFDQLTQLIELGLSNNELTYLPNGIFDKLTNLERLELSSNDLTYLPDGIFDQLTNLDGLWLHDNQLPEETIQSIREKFEDLHLENLEL